MGLSVSPARKSAAEHGLQIVKASPGDRVIALAGNPNVGKSTVFNALTGMNQHTGNWPGKTVASAQGVHRFDGINYILVDLPGTYSLMAHSAEEEVARDFLLFGGADAAIVVCDATCLERNMNLVLQTLEITSNVIVCVNLMDEARKKNITINLPKLQQELGVPVVATTARSGKGLAELMQSVRDASAAPRKVRYPKAVEEAVAAVAPVLENIPQVALNARWLSLRLLEQTDLLPQKIKQHFGYDLSADAAIQAALASAAEILRQAGISPEHLRDVVVASIVLAAEECCYEAVSHSNCAPNSRDRRLDKILTSKLTGIPIMLALLCVIFWLTISGANIPSQLLSDGLFRVQNHLTNLFVWLHAPDWLHGALVLGVYRVLAWVVAVMLPPMAIFFPLFTLLEDFGYLPRVAFNLDHPFKKAHACGKQALTMCMGFGCNAAGVTGCRIIDSPRERLIAIITNSFVPCNGRFPTLIAIISMFFVSAAAGIFSGVVSTLLLTGVILLGILLTLGMSRLLSQTLLKGESSSFALELPPYRTPQFGKVLLRSLLDRTIFVLGRAAAVAAPAGLVIWMMANIQIADMSLLAHCAGFLDPFAQLLGLDGVILLAFILGFPANEIVVPIMLMAYMSTGSLSDIGSLTELKAIFAANGWTWVTAVCTMLFCLVHWPCSTTCLTIKKETGSLKWTALSILIPTACGMLLCFVFASITRIFGIG